METPEIKQVTMPRTAGIAIASLVLGILSVTCLSIHTGIPALILGIMAMNRVGKSAGTLGGKGQALAGVIMGGISFAMLPFVLGIGAGLLLPAFSNARGAAMQAACMNNVRQCTLACQMYAQEHDNTLPKNWDDVKAYIGGETSLQKVLHCHAEAGTTVSYELVQPGKRLADLGQTETAVIVRETKATHRGKRAIGFADGHVEMRADTSTN
ncbi:MAG: DUF4190 domain-containing protein [Kiritimatiellaeota bacterium]|nr:DUF4190 domain-containing protein [Kiritimatiellota bacterium]